MTVTIDQKLSALQAAFAALFTSSGPGDECLADHDCFSLSDGTRSIPVVCVGGQPIFPKHRGLVTLATPPSPAPPAPAPAT